MDPVRRDARSAALRPHPKRLRFACACRKSYNRRDVNVDRAIANCTITITITMHKLLEEQARAQRTTLAGEIEEVIMDFGLRLGFR